jgi:uncharacterized protein (TIRG00374 family)
MSRRAAAVRLLGVVVSVICIVVIAKSVDLDAAAAILRTARFEPLLLVGVVLAVQLVLRATRWRVLLPLPDESEGPREVRLPLRRVLLVLPIGYLGNAVFPARLGEPLRAFILAHREGLDAVAVFGSVVLERVIDTATLALVALAATLAVGGPAWLVQGMAVVAGICIVAIVIAASIAVRDPAAAARFVEAARRRTVLGRIAAAATGFTAGLTATRHPDRLLFAVAISGVCWGLDATIFWLAAQSLGITLPFAGAVLVGAITVLGTALPSAPGYIGTFELAAAGMATLLGVPTASGLALAILAHALVVIPIALVGAAALIAIGGNLGSLSRRAEALR